VTPHVVTSEKPGALYTGGPQGTGYAPATCGELVQGTLHDRSVLITLPAAVGARALAVRKSGPGVDIHPATKRKAHAAANSLLRRAGLQLDEIGVRVTIESPVPEGKGMASSSADIVATCRAIADLFRLTISASDLAAVACSVEPSDGVMFDRPVAFDFMRGELLCDPGRPAPMLAVIVDPGGTVDTVGFRRIPYSTLEQQRVRAAHKLALHGLSTGDLEAVGRAATASALTNQHRHHKAHLGDLIRIVTQTSGLGTCVAHSGTIAAALFEPRDLDEANDAADRLRALLPGMSVSLLRVGSA
jgi:L-threonine kinase